MSRLSPVPLPKATAVGSRYGTARVIGICVLAHVLIVWALIAMNRAPVQSVVAEGVAKKMVPMILPERIVPEETVPEPVPPEPLELAVETATVPELQAVHPQPPALVLEPIAIELPAIELKTDCEIVIPTRHMRQTVQTTQYFAPPAAPVTAPVNVTPVQEPAATPAVVAVAPSPAPTVTGPLDAGEVDRPPRESYAPAPVYPELLRRRGAEGSVSVRMLIDRKGLVKSLIVTANTGSRRFVESVEKAAKKWRFTPPLHRGQPVEVWAEKNLRFSLR